MKRTVITPPTPVIDLARAKLQCKITGSDRDADLTDATAAARDYAEAYLGVPVGEQVQSFAFTSWCGQVELPCDITELQSITSAGATLAQLPMPDGRCLVFDAVAPVVITIKTGWTAATLPGVVKSAMLLLIADLVRNPQKQSETQLYRNETFESLLWPHRERRML